MGTCRSAVMVHKPTTSPPTCRPIRQQHSTSRPTWSIRTRCFSWVWIRIVLSLDHWCGNRERMTEFTKNLIRSIKPSMGVRLRESSRNCRSGSINPRLPRVATGEHVLFLCPISRSHACDVDSFRLRDPTQRRCRQWMSVLTR